MTRALGAAVVAVLLGACHDAGEESEKGRAFAAAMEAHDHRKIYTELTPAILAAIPDDAVEQAVVDYVAQKIGDDFDHQADIVAKLPIGAQATYITMTAEIQVGIDGFNSYYKSAAGQFADQAAEAFEFFSAHDLAALMREANSIRAMDLERARLNPGTNAESQLGPLRSKFMALRERLSTLRIAKIRSMPEFFSGK